MNNADLALYRAKSNGRDRFEFFRYDMNAQIVACMDMEWKLRRAISDQELSVFYQPQVEIRKGNIVGAESLIWWQKPNGDMVPPDRFIPIAVTSGLMRRITGWVLEETVRQCKEWRLADLFKGRFSVNLSPTDLKHPDLAPSVLEILNANNLDPSILELEFTEGMMIESVDAVIENHRQIRDNGIGLAIDDFGTGYSSLAYLRRFSVDRVKIDRTFIKEMETSSDVVAITEAIISMGHALGLKVIAEGVETEAQLDLLQDRNCDEFQGFLMVRAMPANEFIEIVRKSATKNSIPLRHMRARGPVSSLGKPRRNAVSFAVDLMEINPCRVSRILTPEASSPPPCYHLPRISPLMRQRRANTWMISPPSLVSARSASTAMLRKFMPAR